MLASVSREMLNINKMNCLEAVHIYEVKIDLMVQNIGFFIKSKFEPFAPPAAYYELWFQNISNFTLDQLKKFNRIYPGTTEYPELSTIKVSKKEEKFFCKIELKAPDSVLHIACDNVSLYRCA